MPPASIKSTVVRRLLVTRFGGVGYAPYGAFADIGRDLDMPFESVAYIAWRLGIGMRPLEKIPEHNLWIRAFVKRNVLRANRRAGVAHTAALTGAGKSGYANARRPNAGPCEADS